MFKSFGIGRRLRQPGREVPGSILGHIRYLSIYPLASSVSSRIWGQIAKCEIVGIRYFSNFSIPICLDLGWFLWLSTSTISNLSLSMDSWSVMGRDIDEFEEVMRLLAPTVSHLSLDFTASDEDSLEGLKVIQRLFIQLVSIQLLNMDIECSMQALNEEWACTPTLRRLVIYESSALFPQLSQLIATASNLEDLTLDHCYPWDYTKGKAVVQIPASRRFQQIYMQPTSWEFDGEEVVVVRMEIEHV